MILVNDRGIDASGRRLRERERRTEGARSTEDDGRRSRSIALRSARSAAPTGAFAQQARHQTTGWMDGHCRQDRRRARVHAAGGRDVSCFGGKSERRSTRHQDVRGERSEWTVNRRRSPSGERGRSAPSVLDPSLGTALGWSPTPTPPGERALPAVFGRVGKGRWRRQRGMVGQVISVARQTGTDRNGNADRAEQDTVRGDRPRPAHPLPELFDFGIERARRRRSTFGSGGRAGSPVRGRSRGRRDRAGSHCRWSSDRRRVPARIVWTDGKVASG